MSDYTKGPWQVVETRWPHHLGGEHVERRIFTAWDHPQLKAPDGVVNGAVGLGECEGAPARHMVSISEGDAHLISAAPDLVEAIDHPALRELFEAIEDSTTPESDKLWAICVQWFDVRDAAIAKATGGAS